MKTVFIFGAGASVDAGLPLQDQLLKEYFEASGRDEFRPDLERYFRDFFRIDFDRLQEAVFPTFEEALGMLELAIENEQTYGPVYNLEKLHSLRRALIMSMGMLIERRPIQPQHSYRKLINDLYAGGNFRKNEFGFINFNYDILLDAALMSLAAQNLYIDYGLRFSNESADYTSPDFAQWSRPEDARSITYFKPHGSFNWMCCPTCQAIYIKGTKKSNVFVTGYLHSAEHCLRDESELYCLVEPPSFFKQYKSLYLQSIWNQSFGLLADAAKIVFIGFSMQEADIWFKYLLKRSSFGQEKQFYVINPSDSHRIKYERLLGRITYRTETFQNFLEDFRSTLNI